MRSATRKRTGRDPAYLEWIRTLPCVCCIFPWKMYESGVAYSNVQKSASEAAHTGERGLSQKAPDREAIPLCKWHHTEGPESHHRLGKAFWAKWWIDRNELIRKMNEEFDNGTHKAD